MYLVEIRPGVRRMGKPKLVPLADVGNYTGFRSVFAYPPETAEIIELQGGTQGLRGFEVYADTILMDFDDHDPVEFRQLLISEQIAHEIYDSGGRSIHVHIPLDEPVCGSWVPAAMKQWVLRYAPTADISFYSPSGQYRLPGTFHAKHPGKCKTLISSMKGRMIRLEEPEYKPNAPIHEDDEVTEEDLFAELTSKKSVGGRSMQLWKIATKAGQLGKTEEQALDLMRFWNSHAATPPHDEEVLINQLNSAYKRLRRRTG